MEKSGYMSLSIFHSTLREGTMMTNEKKYLADQIGEEYKSWKEGELIFIQAPTGTGKSYFILNVLLDWAVLNRFSILYLVNRKVLKSQIEEKIQERCIELERYYGNDVSSMIEVMTYQTIEQKLLRQDRGEIGFLINKLNQYTFVVYDECHYFYTDSTFNTNTELSFDCLADIFDKKIQIFMSATMDEMKNLIMQRRPIGRDGEDFLSKKMWVQLIQKGIPIEDRIRSYYMESAYDNLKIHTFEDMENMISIIKASKKTSKKWLIFTDSIGRGKNIKKSLTQKDVDVDDEKQIVYEKEDVVFIDADYQNNEDSMESVMEVAKTSQINKKIVIATSVMDNGVSFHDDNLLNIVIMADNKETFVQMFGRKRFSQSILMENVNLYIYKRNQIHFRKRKEELNKKKKVYDEYVKALTVNFHVFYPEVSDAWKKTNGSIRPYHFIEYNWCADPGVQQKILYAAFHNELVRQSVESFCYIVNGVLAINSFSMARIRNLIYYYNNMEKKLQVDENAFLKEQMSWLNISEEDAEIIIEESNKLLEERYREDLRKSIESMLVEGETELTSSENKEWKMTYKSQLIYFLKKANVEISVIISTSKGERTISKENFNICMESADLEFEMSKKAGNFLIKRKN